MSSSTSQPLPVPPTNPPRRLNFIFLLPALGLLYLLTAWASFWFGWKAIDTPSIWLPGGLAVGVLLLDGRRAWRQLLLIFFLAGLLANLLGGLPVALGYAAVDCLEAGLLAWFLFRRMPPRPDFERLRDVLIFFGYSVTCVALTAIPGALIKSLVFQLPFWLTWVEWWAADSLGVILLAPVMLIWAGKVNLVWPRLREGLLLGLLLMLMTGLVFFSSNGWITASPLGSYSLFIFLIWAALRFDQRLSTSVLLLVGMAAVLGTLNGLGEFAYPAVDPASRITALQVFLASLAFTNLVLSALLVERRRAEERYRAQFKNLPLASFTWQRRGADFIMIDYNDAALAFSQGRIASMTGMSAREMYPQRPEVLEDLERCFQTHAVVRRAPHWNLISTSQERDLNISYEFVAPDLVIGHSEDVTEQVRAQQALRESEQRFRLLFENSLEGIILVTLPEGSITAANPAAEHLLGWSAEELRRGGRELIFDLNEPSVSQAIEERARSGVFNGVLNHCRKDGSSFPGEVSSVIFHGPDGSSGASYIFRDISERLQTQQALRESETNLRAMMNAVSESIFLMERDGAILAINETAAARLGSSVPAMLGRSIYEFIPAELAPSRQAHVEQAFVTGQPVSFEDARFGRVIYNHLYPVLDELGRVTRLAVFGSDITEELRAREQSDYQANLLANINEAVLATDTHDTLTAWNKSAELTYGWTAAEALGHSTLEITKTEFPGEQYDDMARKIAELGHWRGEATQARKDGTRFPVEMSVYAQRDEQGRLTGYVSVNHDIGERKRVEDSLRRLAAVVESSDDAIISRDLDEIILTWNAGAERLYGYSAAEAVGQSVRMLLPPEHPDPIDEIHARIRSGEHVRSFETLRRAKDGRLLDVALTISPILNAAGQVVGASSIARDISERKRFEQSLRDSEQHYRDLFEHASLAIFQVTFDGRPLAVNPEFLRMFGYDAWADFSAQVANSSELFPDPGRRDEILRLRTAHPDMRKFESLYQRKDGSTFTGEMTMQVVPNAAGELLYIEGFIQDVSERKQFEQALRANEALYHAMFDTTSAVKLLIDPASGSIVRANQPAAAFSGYPVTQLEAMNINQLNTLPDEQIRLEMANALAERRTYFNFRHRLAAGELRDVEVYSGPLELGGRKLLHSIIHDVTARRQAERIQQARTLLLEFSQDHSLAELLTAALDETETLTGSRIGFFHFLEADQVTISLQCWSTRTVREYCRAEPANTHYPIAEAGVWADAARLRQPVIHNDYNGMPASQRKGLPEGHAALLRELVVPVLRSGRVVCILGVGNKPVDYKDEDVQVAMQMADLVWDIAERKQTEEKLDYSRSLLNNSQAIAKVGGWEFDLKTRQVTWTEEIYEIYGVDQHANPSDIPNAVASYAPEDQPIIDAAFQQAVASGQAYDLELRFVNAQGRRMWVRTNAKPVYTESGPIKLVGTIMDITERKQAELALLAARDELEQRVQERTADLQTANAALEKAVQARDEFLAAMSHELRTPLAGVLGLAQVMQLQTYGPLTDKQIFALKNIETSGQRLLELINDILDFSQAQSGALGLTRTVCSLNEICQDCLKAVAAEAGKKHQGTAFTSSPSVVVMRADARLLAKAIRHLLSNASKFTPDGGSFGIELRGDDAAGVVDLTVWDTGIGIQPENLPRLFKPFVQLDARLQRQYNGTGLGLALVKQLTELHGGRVSVQSQPGQGSRFTISLPWEQDF